ncbi:39S ribosomal protein L34, mitochondrial [Frieseomelitta varia]|uniref:39S ribosomal protein L34, mitochondrial n=1 Tax=Frieseomelitta varia TaxID=561572 RepID=UPI001CB68D17|nr:39S ribosomal protein L34, mitochondrial [Frieseomelitta varia]
MIGTLFSSAYRTFPGLASLNPITNLWNLTLSRSIIRYHFPHPNERRRIKRFGWKTRMSTLGGRKILMRRILKGKYVLSH